MRIKNLTNSPFEIFDAKGERQIIPARGVLEVEPHPSHAATLRSVGYFQIEEGEPVVDPVEQEPENDDIESLRAQYKELTGKDPDKRWSEKSLKKAIDEALEA